MPLLRAALFRKALLPRDRLPGRLLNPVLRKCPGRLRRICLWKRHLPGSRLVRYCNERIDQVEKKVQILRGEGFSQSPPDSREG